MCRVACFPPNFPRERALEIVKDFYVGNDDGTGSVHLEDGKFVCTRYNFSFEKVMDKKLPFLEHMPHPGWTLVHVRAASHGRNTVANTHPFVKGDVAMIHNGVFREYAPVRAALAATHKFKGQTDSEVAAVLWNVAGKRNFMKAVDSGVFMFLKRSGRVDIVCNAGGDLVFQRTKYGVVMASELPHSYQRKNVVMEGHFLLGKNGQIIRSKWEKDIPANWKMGWGYSKYMPVKQNWKSSKKKKTDIFTDEDEFQDAEDRGYIWVGEV